MDRRSEHERADDAVDGKRSVYEYSDWIKKREQHGYDKGLIYTQFGLVAVICGTHRASLYGIWHEKEYRRIFKRPYSRQFLTTLAKRFAAEKGS